jgi:hypothetical protein
LLTARCLKSCLNPIFSFASVSQKSLIIVEFYSATKKNEILAFAGKWMGLENITLSEVSQVQKDKACMFSLICGI